MAEPPSKRPDDGSDDDRDSGQNPFAGTPFEQLFSQLSGGAGGGQGGVPDFGALIQQVQQMLTPYEGTVNWTLARDTARRTVAKDSDPTPSAADREAVDAALRLAELWLDTTCTFGGTGARSAAWSRAEWVEATMDTWRQVVEPMAGQATEAMQKALPDEAKTMAGPMMGMLSQAGGSMFGAQVGQGVGTLASEVLSATDIGIPLTSGQELALVVQNARDFGEGLGVEQSDVFLYLALREAAHQRLFRHVPWLRSHVLGLVEDYGRGVSIDFSGIEEALRSFDPSNLEAAQEVLSGGLFEPADTPAQKAALARLEAVLALIEGWVDDVVGQATNGRMPNASRLQEAIRRRRAAGGPAEQMFASLVGLELRPRRLRDAATLWGALRSREGIEGRDAVWAHPDLMPGVEDLDDPLGFRVGDSGEEGASGDFDAALEALLSGSDRPAEEPKSDAGTPDAEQGGGTASGAQADGDGADSDRTDGEDSDGGTAESDRADGDEGGEGSARQ